jgi:hypothetical protein
MKGFLEGVEPFQLRGWAYDPGDPETTLTIEIVIGERTIARVKANLYRGDLEKQGIGAGDHAFIYNFEQRLADNEIPEVSARIAKEDGTFQVLKKHEPVVLPSVQKAQLTFEGVLSDGAQHPVFILGAARSGTSAIAQGLLKLGRYKGHQEGHILDLLAHWTVTLDRFYDQKGDEATGNRDTALSRVSRTYFQNALDEIFLRTMKAIFPNGIWIDKTPNSNMIHLAPRFYQMWPNARFIFMKRRFLENARSRSRKFPGYDFSRNCREWSGAMEAWLHNRTRLSGAAIEIDQEFLGRDPAATAEALRGFLELSAAETRLLEQAFRYDHPERTSDKQVAHCDITEMGWQQEEREEFERLCSGLMDLYGYAHDSTYYRRMDDENSLVLV